MNRHDSPPGGHGASGRQDITDPATGGSRLLSRQCATCILRAVDCTLRPPRPLAGAGGSVNLTV